MKKLSLCSLLLVTSISYGQNYRISYNLKYKPDSLDTKTKNLELSLLVDAKKSSFVTDEIITNDKPSTAGTVYFYDTPLRQVIQRNHGNNEIFDYETFGMHYYKIPSNTKLNWKVEKETKEENGYKLQKATTTFGKRNWTAWFIPEIPLSEGPYVFYGLPGLIYEISDKKGNFEYKMTALQKLEQPYNTANIIETHIGSNPISITEKQYAAMLLTNYKDPHGEYRGKAPGSWAIGTDDGDFIQDIDKLNQYTKIVKAKMKKNNNPIDLNKALIYKD